ncbi:hypothetical protein L596_022984 [Steinernema carpocapsae]|uniref:Uncharacterized protein n=1 Tax=Steinernema carpocapsae TaxID=34508 RepID=A0A4U5MC84_STECR|nr:hypothetical protein L596_022984 [Steinernema carpocapsae]
MREVFLEVQILENLRAPKMEKDVCVRIEMEPEVRIDCDGGSRKIQRSRSEDDVKVNTERGSKTCRFGLILYKIKENDPESRTRLDSRRVRPSRNF